MRGMRQRLGLFLSCLTSFPAKQGLRPALKREIWQVARTEMRWPYSAA
jgi:hypothetical protein